MTDFRSSVLLAGERVELLDGLDLVAEQRDAPGAVFQMGGEDLDRVAAHAERAALEIHVAALVLLGDEVGEELALVEAVADGHLEGHRRVGLDRADTVDAGDRGDDDDVVALEQGAGGGVAHPVDLLVDRGLLLDEGVRARHVGFRLVVVVVGDEVFDGVIREEVLELAVELRRQRLVGRQHEGRALGALDDVGGGEGLAGAGDAEQHLGLVVVGNAGDEVGDRRRLVAHRRVVGGEAEGDAALGLVRAMGAMGQPDLAVLDQRIALGDQPVEGVDGCGDAALGEAAGVFQRDVHAGDGIEAGGGALLRVGRAAHGRAAGRLALAHAAGAPRLRGLIASLSRRQRSPPLVGRAIRPDGRSATARFARPGVFFLDGPADGFFSVRLAFRVDRRGLRDLVGPAGDGAGGDAFEAGLRRFLEAAAAGGRGGIEGRVVLGRPTGGTTGGISGGIGAAGASRAGSGSHSRSIERRARCWKRV